MPDSRGVTINVHYSISRLQTTGYQPRLADDRVGYFLTVVKDFQQAERPRPVRPLHQPLAPGKAAGRRRASLSAQASRSFSGSKRRCRSNTASRSARGFEEWNKAFEKAGWLNAIEVRQQPDDADWDPEDINYNTFRWITSNAGFAMGPSRVNPYTGQILDADIIFDADFLQFWKEEFETFTPQSGGRHDRRPAGSRADARPPAELARIWAAAIRTAS